MSISTQSHFNRMNMPVYAPLHPVYQTAYSRWVPTLQRPDQRYTTCFDRFFAWTRHAWEQSAQWINQHAVFLIGGVSALLLLGLAASVKGNLVAKMSAKIRSSILRTPFSETFEIFKRDIPYGWTLHSPSGTVDRCDTSTIIPKLAAASRITLGDLHGHYRKLVETLVATGLAEMPKEAAVQFIALSDRLEKGLQQEGGRFLDSPQTDKLVTELEQLIDTMQWTGNQQLFLLGDVIADRGPTDTLTLAVIERLNRQKPGSIVSFASNHDFSALQSLLSGRPILGYGQQASFFHAGILAAKDPAKAKLLLNRYRTFLSQQKLWHYEPETETLYVHAPITEWESHALFERMKAKGKLPADWDYQRLNKTNLAAFVENANQYYREVIHKTLQRGVLNPKDEALFGDEVNGFLWKRYDPHDTAYAPFRGQGVKRLVHGHDSPWQPLPDKSDYRVIDLNQDIRKGIGISASGYSSLYVEP